jgi:hypothetical protein
MCLDLTPTGHAREVAHRATARAGGNGLGSEDLGRSAIFSKSCATAPPSSLIMCCHADLEELTSIKA